MCALGTGVQTGGRPIWCESVESKIELVRRFLQRCAAAKCVLQPFGELVECVDGLLASEFLMQFVPHFFEGPGFAGLDPRHLQNVPAEGTIDRLRYATLLQGEDRRSEEHTSELQSLMRISYAVFCLNKKQHYFQTLEHHTLCC